MGSSAWQGARGSLRRISRSSFWHLRFGRRARAYLCRLPSADAAEDDVAVETRITPLEPAPNASSRGTVAEAQVRLAKSKIEPVILAPSSFPLHFGGGGRAVRGQQWRGARRRRPRRAASRVNAAHDARGLQPVHLRQRRRRDVALLLCAMRAPDLQSHEVILASTRCRQRRRSSCAMRATVGSGAGEGEARIPINLTPGSEQ